MNTRLWSTLLWLPLALPMAAELRAEGLEDIEGKKVSVVLQSGTTYDDFEVARVATSTGSGEPVRLLGTCDNGRRRTFKFDSINKITSSGETLFEAGELTAKAQPLSKEQAAEKQKQAEHEKWLARLRARGIKPFGPISDETHAAAIAKEKKRFEEVRALLPTMQMVETEHFLFCTNIPPQEVGVFVASLDRMYGWMQQAYGVDPEQSVWKGKAGVYAFQREAEFRAFEMQFMKNNASQGAQGLCHSDSDRNVCISCYQGQNAGYFGVVLVHETSHGFIACYQTPQRVPSWVNEGMAEVIASKMVPSSQGVQLKEKSFVKSMFEMPQPMLGEAFFAVDQNIPFDRYGAASSMARFMLEADQAKYVKFVQLLKEGEEWEEALQASYNASKQQLVSAYGQWIGIPHLMP